MPVPSRISATLEDYLEAIAELGLARQPARSRDLAARLGVHKSTVTAALHSLADKGLVLYAPYSAAALTAAGQRLAAQVCRRHRVLRRFLRDILGLAVAQADENACRLEHAIDRECLDRLVHLGEFLESSAEWRTWAGRGAGPAAAAAADPRGAVSL
jgi:DtxR family Mn-dependent transcriptional regulator